VTATEGTLLGVLLACAVVMATGAYFSSRTPTARALSLAAVVLAVSAVGWLGGADRPAGHSTPAPVESVRPPAPTCPPGMLGPQWLDQRWVCIPYDQAG